MALKAILDSIDDLPEDVKSEYSAVTIDGKETFVLQVEGVDAHPGVKTLKSAYERVKQDKTKLTGDLKIANDKLKALPDDFDAEEWLRLKTLDEGDDDATKKAAREAHLQGQKKIFKDRIKALNERHTTDMAAKDVVIAEKDKEIDGYVIDGGLTKALVDAGVPKQFLRGAKALLRSSVKTVVEDGKTRAFFQTDMGEAEVEEYVKGWVQGEEGKAYVPAPTGGGAGGGAGQQRQGGGDSENPFLQKNWNKTKQAQLHRDDATKAERLAKSAGFKDVGTALKAMRAPEAAKA